MAAVFHKFEVSDCLSAYSEPSRWVATTLETHKILLRSISTFYERQRNKGRKRCARSYRQPRWYTWLCFDFRSNKIHCCTIASYSSVWIIAFLSEQSQRTHCDNVYPGFSFEEFISTCGKTIIFKSEVCFCTLISFSHCMINLASPNIFCFQNRDIRSISTIRDIQMITQWKWNPSLSSFFLVL